MKSFPDADISVAVVWIDVLRSDNAEEGLKATERFVRDPRVKFFHDSKRRTGTAFMKAVPELAEGGVMAWDIYMFYEADAKWKGKVPPQPATHMYQLGGPEGTLPRNIRGRALVEALRLTMEDARSGPAASK